MIFTVKIEIVPVLLYALGGGFNRGSTDQSSTSGNLTSHLQMMTARRTRRVRRSVIRVEDTVNGDLLIAGSVPTDLRFLTNQSSNRSGCHQIISTTFLKFLQRLVESRITVHLVVVVAQVFHERYHAHFRVFLPYDYNPRCVLGL